MKLLTTKQAAEKLNISERRVRALIASGKIPATRFGSVWMIKASDLKKAGNRKPGRPASPK